MPLKKNSTLSISLLLRNGKVFKNADCAPNARINLHYAVVTSNGRISRLFLDAGNPCRACRSSVRGNFHFLELSLCGSLDPSRNWKDRDGPRMANALLIWLILTILRSRNVFVLWRWPFFFDVDGSQRRNSSRPRWKCIICMFFTCTFPCVSG